MLARDAARWDGRARGVYVTLQDIEPALLARAANRVVERAQQTTADTDVLRFRWLPIDLDPVRPAGISSTDIEHDAALASGAEVTRWLVGEQGFPAESIVQADSGNGAHVLVRIDEPADAPTRALIRRCLGALDLLWSTPMVVVDTTTANPARIWKLYGTTSCKGDATEDRPHRRSSVLHSPERIVVVSRALLERLAALAPEDRGASARRTGESLEIDAWLARHGIAVARTRPWQGGTLYTLDGCPIDDTHKRDRAAYVIMHPSGAISAGCHHARCQAWGWRELRERYEPAGTRARRDATNRNDDAPDDGGTGAPWSRAVAASVLLSEPDADVEWIARDIAAPGSITGLASPRGLARRT